MTQAEIFILAVVGLILILRAARRSRRPQPHRPKTPTTAPETPPRNAILVDGSNVMFWGGTPSQKVLRRVIDDLRQRGLQPIVIFDASVGYRLGGSYLGSEDMAARLDLPRAQVFVVDKGVVADEVLLDLAQIHRLRIVSNDRYRDWRARFPGAAKRGALVQGSWKEGSVVWRAPADLVRKGATQTA